MEVIGYQHCISSRIVNSITLYYNVYDVYKYLYKYVQTDEIVHEWTRKKVENFCNGRYISTYSWSLGFREWEEHSPNLLYIGVFVNRTYPAWRKDIIIIAQYIRYVM